MWSCIFCLAANNCCVSSDSDKLANGLKRWENNIPLPYHEDLDETVLLYATKPLPDSFLTYSPMIDSALMQRNLPWELKYLPLALSGMQTDYTDGDRRGVWQLPTLTAMHYGLTIDETRDERLDVEASTYAALNYLDELHQLYGDWWHSILAYTNSPVALQHALAQHGATPELWDFREQELLPNTQVIADFIACIYLGHENRLKFAENAEPFKVTRLVETPQQTPDTTTMDSSTLQETQDPETLQTTDSNITYYKIKKGDTLSKIAVQYHVTVADLMTWNQLDSDLIREGQTLIIKQ